MSGTDDQAPLPRTALTSRRAAGSASLSRSLRPLRLAWGCLGLLGLLSAAATVRGQANPPAGLKTNEVEVQIGFVMSSKTRSGGLNNVSEGVQSVLAADSSMKVTGRFAGKVSTPAPGKRTLLLTRRLPGELAGSFTEHYLDETIGDDGEGGFKPDAHTVRREEWSNSGVDLEPGVDFVLDLDLDSSTWTFYSLPDAVDAWVREVVRGYHYTGSYFGPEDGEWIWKILPPRSPTGLDTASSYLSTHWFKVQVPLALQRTGDTYSGDSGVWSVPVGEVYSAAWSLWWKVLDAAPEVELRVSSPKLREWRPDAVRDPQGGNARLRGTPLDLTAEVVSPSGANVSALRIRKLRWWLEGTSRLPGVAMNWPYGSNDTSPDLEIGHARATAEGQNLELTELTTLRKKIQIVPYDWGGWSTLRVEAELDDGRKLQGKLKGQSGDETAIRLPAREENSKVSSHWKQKLGVADMADDADEDFIPAGGPDGDGFTLFEEYRGFYGWLPDSKQADPQHLSTNPMGKTVFIYDRIDDDHTRKGISLFRTASLAHVFLVKPGSGLLDESRVMNRNPGDAPSKGPQHAIGIRRDSGWGPKSPGSPGAADVSVPTLEAIRRLHPTVARADLYDRAIAQHLLTVCRVGRPGTGDKMVTLTVSRGEDGGPVVEADGVRVTLRDEATGHDLGEDWLREVEREATIARARARAAYRGTPLAARMEREADKAAREIHATKTRYVAVRGGEHSGPLGNIMRGAFAWAYRIEGTDTIVVLPQPSGEKLGYQLTTTSVGDGYNDPNWDRPRTRYSSSQRPPSRSQFNVSDHTP